MIKNQEEVKLAPWDVTVWPDGDLVILSLQFEHDIALKVSGDFETTEQAVEYAELIASRLNQHN